MTNYETVNAAIIFSGTGSTAQAFVNATQEGGALHGLVNPVVAIATNTHAGIEQTRATGIPVEVIERRKYQQTDEGVELYGRDLLDTFENEEYSDVNALFLLGCLARMSQTVLDKFPGRAGNQHPGILDPGRDNDFGGRGMTYEAVPLAHLLYFWAIQHESPFIHATFHHALEEYDTGEIISVMHMPLPLLEQGNVTIADFREDPELRKHLIYTAHDVQKRLKPIEHENVISSAQELAYGGEFPGFRWQEPMFPPEHAGRIAEAKETGIYVYKNYIKGK